MPDFAAMQELLLRYSYLIILGWTFLEGETIVIVAGFTAQKGWLNPWLIALCAFLGSFTSDQIMFALGKYKGQKVLNRFPRLEKKSQKVRLLIVKYETPLILGFRFVYGVRNVTPIMLGVSGVSHVKFFSLNLIGAAVWALSFTFGGYYFGHLFAKYTEDIAHAERWLIGFILAVAILVMLRRHLRQKKEARSAGPGPSVADSASAQDASNQPAAQPEDGRAIHRE